LKETSSLKNSKNLEHTSGLLAITVDDLLYIHGNDDSICGRDKIVNQLSPLFQPNMLREPRHHPTKVHPGPQLHGGKGDAGPLPYPYHHHPFIILYHDEPPKASRLLLMVRNRQPLLHP
jgi:hypothetical protein